MRAIGVTCLIVLLTGPLSLANAAEPDRFKDVSVKSSPVGGSVHMLTGAGGNMAVSIGKDGTLLVDDDFAALAARVQSAIAEIGGSQPKIVLNTHFHADHTGGNALFGERGVIIANEQVRYRLLNDPALPRSALPVVTYADRLRVQFNDDEIDVIHLPPGTRTATRSCGSATPTYCTPEICSSTACSRSSMSKTAATSTDTSRMWRRFSR